MVSIVPEVVLTGQGHKRTLQEIDTESSIATLTY